MRCRIVLTFAVLCLSCGTLLARSPKSAVHAPDPYYRSALAAANRFLTAWQTQDHQTGIIMLSDTARQHTSPELLQSFFSPGPQPAFEISRGRRTTAGEYVFPVVLFESASSRRRSSKIIVTRSGKDDWAINNLP